MSDSHEIFRKLESLRDDWADIMIHALTENGHVHLTRDERYALKEKLMQLLTGSVRV